LNAWDLNFMNDVWATFNATTNGMLLKNHSKLENKCEH
jgi:hypothetical protein